ncbi:MAG: acetyl-CoA C-acetyltransferase, partial [Acidobacteriota bacterium]|nr:acetyl-CoA C-acetyltransferase [Acidobacteriota bacterium]
MAKLTEDIYLVAAVRTPIGKFGGTLASLTAAQLGTESAKATLERSGIDPTAVDEVIFGNARQAGVGPNVARQVAIKSGLRHEVPAYTVNQACGSGLRSIMNAADQIRLGAASVILAGGTESMSNTPYLLPRARWGYRMGHDEVIDGMIRDGFMCPLADEMMGSTAETLAQQYGISREEQDRYAVESQAKAGRAYAEDRFAHEIVPVRLQGRKGETLFEKDEHPRFDVTLGSMAKLPPVFREGGSVHAGNSSGVTDGAASMLVASAAAVKAHGLTPMARIVGYAQAGVDPKIMGIGPVPATRKLLEETGHSLDDIDLIELN